MEIHTLVFGTYSCRRKVDMYGYKTKYGSQVIFGRIHRVAESMRHMRDLWKDMSAMCRYRDPDTDVCKIVHIHKCHWCHCSVDENTEDEGVL
jgi:hypothetical protein